MLLKMIKIYEITMKIVKQNLNTFIRLLILLAELLQVLLLGKQQHQESLQQLQQLLLAHIHMDIRQLVQLVHQHLPELKVQRVLLIPLRVQFLNRRLQVQKQH